MSANLICSVCVRYVVGAILRSTAVCSVCLPRKLGEFMGELVLILVRLWITLFLGFLVCFCISYAAYIVVLLIVTLIWGCYFIITVSCIFCTDRLCCKSLSISFFNGLQVMLQHKR